MVHWGWLIAAWVIGDIMGMVVIIICIGGEEKEKEKNAQRYAEYVARQTLRGMPPESISFSIVTGDKKTADAATSTAAHMGRKDYFL